MSFQKKIITLATSLILISGQSYADKKQPELSVICRGEISDKLIDAVTACSVEDFNQAYLEIRLLENEIRDTKSKLDQKTATKGANGVTHDLALKIELGSAFVAIASGSSLFALKGPYPAPPVEWEKGIRRINIATSVTLLMGAIGWAVGHVERKNIQVQIPDIVKFQDYIKTLESNVKIRRATLETMMKLKADF